MLGRQLISSTRPRGRRRQGLALELHDAVGPLGEVAVEGDGGQVLLAGQADAGDDRDPQAQPDVALDDLPAPRLQGHPVVQAVLVEDVIDDAPGRQVLGGQDQGILGDVLDRDLGLHGQGVVAGGDQHRVVAKGGVVADVLGDLDHRPDGEVDGVAAEHLQAVAAGDVLQPELDAGIRRAVLLDGLGRM